MLNLKELRAIQHDLDRRAQEEYDSELKEYVQKEFIQLLKTRLINDELINTKSRIEIKQSSRVINNWEKEGIIDKEASSEGKWRKYSKVGAIWISLVAELREFGFSLEKIKKVKGQLSLTSVKGFTPLEYAIIFSIVAQPVVLIVYKDAGIALMPESAYKSAIINNSIVSHLYFNILPFVENEFPNGNFHTIEKAGDYQLNEKELKLLYYLRTGDYQHIKITLKEGDIFLLEGQKKIDKTAKIIDLIKKSEYQNIEIKTEGGSVVHISQTEKIKL